MTERKKLSLNKPAQADTEQATFRKPPVRGTAPRTRRTAAEAAKAREEAAARAAQAPRRHDDERFQREERPARPARPERGAAPARPARDPRAPRDARDDRGPRGPREERPTYAPRPRPEPRDNRPVAAPRPPAPAAEPVDHDGRIRLSKLMSERGLASRREADEWIEHGWVRVDGEVVSELGTRVRPDQDITIDPLARTQQAQRVTILLHKPMGYVSGQAEDGYEPAAVLITPENRWRDDRLPIKLTRGHLRNLAPCGRLDIDSTGLLVLSQDGRIAKQLIGEDSGIEKEYLVRVQWMAQPDAENVSAVVPP
ncbi:MAG TPA: S4 domain-containing protein, partial [Aquabacterium sp.]|nr:S4 domain-containing protein [Aquabacterium sp.]